MKFSNFFKQAVLESEFVRDSNNKAYQDWIRAVRKKYPDAQVSGNSSKAQMVDWTTKNNKEVGNWDGKKGTINEDAAIAQQGTATESYQRLYAEVVSQLKEVEHALVNHRGAFIKSGGENWGFVGDLESINETLKDVKGHFNTPVQQ